ncbi:MAG TPA: hypothetical protein VFG45_09815 [Candidatus Nitrosocosmicus sp.]|nr:hypothetical protein [Candidatus Nitrosocosmicus sp.]
MGKEQPIDNEFRTKAIIDYIIKHQECNKQEVVNYCTEKGYATRNPVMKILDELKDEGILTVGSKKKNSKALILTIDSANLLILPPRDFEYLYTLFGEFVSDLKKWCENPQIKYHIRSNKSFYGISEDDILANATFLAYDLVDTVTDIYSMYFIFILPKLLSKQEHITKLYSIYFSWVGRIYSLLACQLKNFIPNYSIETFNESIICNRYLDSKNQTQNWKVIRAVAASQEMSLSDSVFKILEFVWKNNPEIASAVIKNK